MLLCLTLGPLPNKRVMVWFDLKIDFPVMLLYATVEKSHEDFLLG